jgi:hypothetical protein
VSVTPSVEARLSALENEVAELKKRITPQNGASWFSKVAGSFENDPEFDEVVRLGREIRSADKLDGEEG